jgi:glycosyltransferase involved in cell wall biosynthesis
VKIHVIVPVYNEPVLLEACLLSIAQQDPPADSVFVADDCSTDHETRSVIAKWVAPRVMPDNWGFHWGSINVGATRNIVEAIRSRRMEPEDVVLLVDGDDRLAHPGVIGRLRRIYSDRVEVAYGSYTAEPPNPGCPKVKPYPVSVLRKGTVRAFTKKNGAWFNHPLSFRRRIFDAIDQDEFERDGEWLRYGYDMTLMMPALELAGTRVAYCSDVLYVYTSDREDSDWCANGEGVNEANLHVLNQPRRHEPL